MTNPKPTAAELAAAMAFYAPDDINIPATPETREQRCDGCGHWRTCTEQMVDVELAGGGADRVPVLALCPERQC